jgi:hypothetical protein
MSYNFSPSINIQRDADKELYYLVTPNAQDTYMSIHQNFMEGRRAFTLIGSYGTGKSAFLLALERQLKSRNNYFTPLLPITTYEFINIVGETVSLSDLFFTRFEGKHKSAAGRFKAHLEAVAAKGVTTVLCIDEFGKFLEYATQKNPSVELYFLQQLAELANEPSLNLLLVLTLHQNFEGYSKDFGRTQQEWEKVKGRFVELPFNEPVEQLLFLATEYLSAHKTEKHNLPINITKVFDAILSAKVFNLKNTLQPKLGEQLYPLDLLAASIVTQSLYTYGQNERSLFAFLGASDERGLRNYSSVLNPYYNVACVYDYLVYNFYTKLNSKTNPHYTQWSALRRAIQRVENEEDTALRDDAIKIVKTLGLLDIFVNISATININFLIAYGNYCLGINDTQTVLDYLVKKKIIKYKNFKDSYTLFEGSDFDIELALINATANVPTITSVVPLLKEYFNLPLLPAKKSHYDKGTPRFFEFRIVDKLEKIVLSKDIDGVILLVFDDKIVEPMNTGEAVLVGFYQNVLEIKNMLIDIQRIDVVMAITTDDKVAQNDLQELKYFHIEQLNNHVLQSLYRSNENISWYFEKEKLNINSWRKFNETLSYICDEIYTEVPVFKNELINRQKLSGQISAAKKALFRLLHESKNIENLGFKEDEFPPEKSIYLSLLKEAGIHALGENGYQLQAPKKDSAFADLWAASEGFLDASIGTRKSLGDFENMLSHKPYKLKQGFIDFWLPIFIYTRYEDLALFQDNTYIPNIDAGTLDLLSHHPEKFEIRKYDIQGVKLNLFHKYRSFIQRTSDVKANTQTFIETIKPFLQFYKGLPEYTKQTKRLSAEALAIRNAVATAREPETVFFFAFPAALGYSMEDLNNNENAIEAYIQALQNAVRELRTSYDELINRIEAVLQKEIGLEGKPFEEYVKVLQTRYKNLQAHLLLPQQKVLYNRINSQLDDRKAYLESIAQVLINNKSLKTANDTDEPILYSRLQTTLRELDNLTEITVSDIKKESETAYKIEITALGAAMSSNILRLSQKDNAAADELLLKVEKTLGKNKKQNAAVLLKLLKQQLE